jgi:hypothetical protein
VNGASIEDAQDVFQLAATAHGARGLLGSAVTAFVEAGDRETVGEPRHGAVPHAAIDEVRVDEKDGLAIARLLDVKPMVPSCHR